MKKYNKKICIIAFVCMILLCMSIVSYAESYSGECGSTAFWQIDIETGIVTISGSGKITSNPWKNYKNSIKGVVIEGGITSVMDSAFAYYPYLEEVTIGDDVTSIGNYTFSGCSKLSDIYLGTSLKKIGACAFDNCTALTDINIPNSVTSIDGGAFGYCSSLKVINFSSNLTSIGNYAFSGCSALESIIIPTKVSLIGNYAFSGCSSLKNITINDGLALIGSCAFEYCTSLETVHIPKGVSQIGEQAFNACDKLMKFEVSEDNAYYYADNSGVLFTKNMETLIQYPIANEQELYIVPNAVTTIDNWAFFKSHITYLYIPKNVSTIGYASFYECDNLYKIWYEGTQAEFSDCAIGTQNTSLEAANKIYSFLFGCGDINLDGNINVMDVTMLRFYLVDQDVFVPFDWILDVNNDGDINVQDVTTLRRYIVGGYGIVFEN